MEYFSSKNVKKCKPKKQPEKKTNQKAKKCKKKQNKIQKQRQKEHIRSKTSNLNLYLVAKANTWPHANKYSNYQQQAIAKKNCEKLAKKL